MHIMHIIGNAAKNVSDRALRIARNTMIAIIFVVAVLMLLVMFKDSQTSRPAPSASQTYSQPATHEQPVDVPQQTAKPVTAAYFARQLNCGKFHDDGPGAGGLVLDSGVCWIGSTKYAIDTFPGESGRNLWVKLSEGLGGNPPLKETSTMVFYKAGDQSNDYR